MTKKVILLLPSGQQHFDKALTIQIIPLEKIFGIYLAQANPAFRPLNPRGTMPQTKILVVEDQVARTKEIEGRLRGLGYPSPTTASSGAEAVRKVATCCPDLVLIDIQLGGGVDGIEAAVQIHEQYNVPILYLMENAKGEALRNGGTKEPFPYILIPFEDDSLRLGIERALYKHKVGKVWRSLGSEPSREKRTHRIRGHGS